MLFELSVELVDEDDIKLEAPMALKCALLYEFETLILELIGLLSEDMLPMLTEQLLRLLLRRA